MRCKIQNSNGDYLAQCIYIHLTIYVQIHCSMQLPLTYKQAIVGTVCATESLLNPNKQPTGIPCLFVHNRALDGQWIFLLFWMCAQETQLIR